nr:MAG TPA: hypothetical protein [Caudoviricetes sp.]
MNKNFNSNPLFQRAQQMAQGKNEQQLEQTAENLCRQRGIDMQQALKQFQQFKKMFGIK